MILRPEVTTYVKRMPVPFKDLEVMEKAVGEGGREM